jgi:hypothetical protein
MKTRNCLIRRIILCASVFFIVPLYAAGEVGLAVLKIGVGARAAAMGEAFVASSNDASGIYWNPAGPAYVTQRQVHFTYNHWIQGIQNHVASILLPYSCGTFGLGIMLNNVSDIEHRVIASEEPIGYFSSHDFSITFGYARMIIEKLALGLNVKYLNEKIYIETASGFAVDIGVKYQSPIYGLYCAAAVQNLGITAKLADEKINLPKTVRVGVAYYMPIQINQGSWILAADFSKIFQDQSHFNFGTELSPVPHLTIRAGYQTGYEERSISAGFGIQVNRFTIDYAYVPFASGLGNSQRFSCLVAF